MKGQTFSDVPSIRKSSSEIFRYQWHFVTWYHDVTENSAEAILQVKATFSPDNVMVSLRIILLLEISAQKQLFSSNSYTVFEV